MAMSTLPSSSISSLLFYSSCDEAACVGGTNSLKFYPSSVDFCAGGRRRGSFSRSPRRLSVQSRDNESCAGEFKITCENESIVNRQLESSTTTATGRRTCLLAMAMVCVLVSRDNAGAEVNAETEAVNTTEAVDSPKAEAVSPPKSEAVNPPNSEDVNPPNTEAVSPPKTEAVSPPKTEAVDAPSLELYVDEKEGFKFLRPALWNKVEKAGATVLFEDPAKRGNTIGVVVNPVRISSLKDFGTPSVVADKLIAAERKKPSTNDAQLVRVQERQANGDIPLYCLEYTLDSSRGQKRILSAVTVASKKLYILNITYVDSAAAPAPAAMAEAFTQVLNSFDLVA